MITLYLIYFPSITGYAIVQIPDLLFKMIDYILKSYFQNENLTSDGRSQRNHKQPKKQYKDKKQNRYKKSNSTTALISDVYRQMQ